MMTRWLLNFNKLMAVFICLHQMISGVTSVNVALNKVAKDCKSQVLPEITDGDRDPSRSVTLYLGCFEILIDLGDNFYIHYMALFARKETNTLVEFVMHNEANTKSCSEFWGPLTSQHGLRVNCRTQDETYSRVAIKTREMHELPISEIEVHNIATQAADEKVTYFRGCFVNFVGSNERTITPMVPDICQSHCSNFLFFGIKEYSHCLCANDYNDNDEMSPELCNTLCYDEIKSCGGNRLTSVYLGRIRLPSYQNCTSVVPEDQSLSVTSNGMSVSECMRNCDEYIYAYLKKGVDCFCSNVFTSVVEAQRCNKICAGNSSEICGGEEAMSVYQTCLKQRPDKSIKCSKQFKCAGSYDMYGLCLGGCKEGYHGDYCLERDYTTDTTASTTVSTTVPTTLLITIPTTVPTTIPKPIPATVPTTIPATVPTTIPATVPTTIPTTTPATVQSICQNPNYCADKSYTECVIHKGVDMCICIVGYSRTNPFSECEDIDECEFEPCDAATAVCINSNGTYICDCLPGFRKRMMSYDVCLANTTVGGEFQLNPFYYLNILVYISPFLSVAFMFIIICLFALPTKTESLDEAPSIDSKRRKSTVADVTVPTKKK